MGHREDQGYESAYSYSVRRCRIAEYEPEKPRRVPADYSHSDKQNYIQIAVRAQSESVNEYAILCLGLQAFLASRRLARKQQEE